METWMRLGVQNQLVMDLPWICFEVLSYAQVLDPEANGTVGHQTPCMAPVGLAAHGAQDLSSWMAPELSRLCIGGKK